MNSSRLRKVVTAPQSTGYQMLTRINRARSRPIGPRPAVYTIPGCWSFRGMWSRHSQSVDSRITANRSWTPRWTVDYWSRNTKTLTLGRRGYRRRLSGSWTVYSVTRCAGFGHSEGPRLTVVDGMAPRKRSLANVIRKSLRRQDTLFDADSTK